MFMSILHCWYTLLGQSVEQPITYKPQAGMVQPSQFDDSVGAVPGSLGSTVIMEQVEGAEP